jgi:hypothetical protein
MGKNGVAESVAAIRSKTGFGERREGAKPLRTKIFSLPKIATQSPRRRLSATIEQP